PRNLDGRDGERRCSRSRAAALLPGALRHLRRGGRPGGPPRRHLGDMVAGYTNILQASNIAGRRNLIMMVATQAREARPAVVPGVKTKTINYHTTTEDENR